MRRIVLVVAFIIIFGGLIFFLLKSSVNHNEEDLSLVMTQATTETTTETIESEDKNPDISSTATYRIDFIASWNSSTQPNYYPEGAHFSPLVVFSHDEDLKLFQLGEIASPGIEEMAETGATELIESEIQNLIDSNSAFRFSVGERIDSPGATSVNLEFNLTHSYFTFVSMVAPSPDWFVASDSINLIEDNQWVKTKEYVLTTYDAGSDSGTGFNSEDEDTDPKEPITEIDDSLQSIARIRVERIDN